MKALRVAGITLAAALVGLIAINTVRQAIEEPDGYCREVVTGHVEGPGGADIALTDEICFNGYGTPIRGDSY